MQGTMPGARRRGRPRTAWMDNIKTWTGLSVEQSRDDRGQGQREKVWPTLGFRTAKEQNSYFSLCKTFSCIGIYLKMLELSELTCASRFF